MKIIALGTVLSLAVLTGCATTTTSGLSAQQQYKKLYAESSARCKALPTFVERVSCEERANRTLNQRLGIATSQEHELVYAKAKAMAPDVDAGKMSEDAFMLSLREYVYSLSQQAAQTQAVQAQAQAVQAQAQAAQQQARAAQQQSFNQTMQAINGGPRLRTNCMQVGMMTHCY